MSTSFWCTSSKTRKKREALTPTLTLSLPEKASLLRTRIVLQCAGWPLATPICVFSSVHGFLTKTSQGPRHTSLQGPSPCALPLNLFFCQNKIPFKSDTVRSAKGFSRSRLPKTPVCFLKSVATAAKFSNNAALLRGKCSNCWGMPASNSS